MALLCEAVGGSDGVDASASPREGARVSAAPASSGNDGRGGEDGNAELDNLSDGERAIGIGGEWAAPSSPTQSRRVSLPDTELCLRLDVQRSQAALPPHGGPLQ